MLRHRRASFNRRSAINGKAAIVPRRRSDPVTRSHAEGKRRVTKPKPRGSPIYNLEEIHTVDLSVRFHDPLWKGFLGIGMIGGTQSNYCVLFPITTEERERYHPRGFISNATKMTNIIIIALNLIIIITITFIFTMMMIMIIMKMIMMMIMIIVIPSLLLVLPQTWSISLLYVAIIVKEIYTYTRTRIKRNKSQSFCPTSIFILFSLLPLPSFRSTARCRFKEGSLADLHSNAR